MRNSVGFLGAVVALCLASSLFGTDGNSNRDEISSSELQAVYGSEFDAYLKELIPIINALGQGDVKTAGEMLEERLLEPPGWINNSFGPNTRTRIDQLIAPFKNWKLDFESVDLKSIKQISSQAVSMLLIANGKQGPHMFSMTVFRHKGKWRVLQFEHQSNIITIARAVIETKLKTPIHFPLQYSDPERLAMPPQGKRTNR